MLGSCMAAPRAQHVFIVSFDGGNPEVMRRSPMPITMEMAKSGATSWNAQTVMPSITLTSHTSMLTGVQPAKHGVLWNDWIPLRGLIKTPTIFGLARDYGYTTALFAGKLKFRHLNLPGAINEFQVPASSATVVAKAAAKYIEEKKPNLCFVHFADPDVVGHRDGWGSPQQIQAFAEADAALKVLREAVQRAGIEHDSVFILSADHGGHEKSHGTNLPADMTIPWIAWGPSVSPRFEIKTPVSTCDTAATALWLLDVPVPASFDGKPVESAFKPAPTKNRG